MWGRGSSLGYCCSQNVLFCVRWLHVVIAGYESGPDCAALARALKSNTTIKSLDLSSACDGWMCLRLSREQREKFASAENSLGDAGMKELAFALASNSTLTSLTLWGALAPAGKQ
jgi:hypothetical protein